MNGTMAIPPFLRLTVTSATFHLTLESVQNQKFLSYDTNFCTVDPELLNQEQLKSRP
jgi:hypothetical protein